MVYTIVLTPPVEQASKYIKASQTLCGDCQPSYLLTGRGTSFPHITVVQFACESEDLVYRIWIEMREKMSRENIIPFSPPLTGVAFVEGVGPYANTTWVELSVSRGEIDSPIMKVHYAAVDVLEHFGVKILNPRGNGYRPHITLGRMVMPEQMKTWPRDLCSNPGEFNLELGLSDENWQYAETLESFPADIVGYLITLTEKIDQLNQNIDTISRVVSESVMVMQGKNPIYSDPAYLAYDESVIQERDNGIMFDAEPALSENIKKLFPQYNLIPTYEIVKEETIVRGHGQKGKQIERPMYLFHDCVRAVKTTLTITYVMEGEVWTPKISLSKFSLIEGS